MIGRRYFLRGELVEVICRWRTPERFTSPMLVCRNCGMLNPRVPPELLLGAGDAEAGLNGWCCSDPDHVFGPGRDRRGHTRTLQNVAIRYVATGELVIRPFRGLRRA